MATLHNAIIGAFALNHGRDLRHSLDDKTYRLKHSDPRQNKKRATYKRR